MTLPTYHDEIIVTEQLGVDYSCSLVMIHETDAASLIDCETGSIIPLQTVPSLPIDRTADAVVNLALLKLSPLSTLRMKPNETILPTLIELSTEENDIIISNGRLAVRVPGTGLLEQPFPGPIMAIKIADGSWMGSSSVVDVPYRGAVETVIESLGPCCVQWRTTYRWGNDSCFTVRVRWASDSDTLQVIEELNESGEGAVEWYPFGDTPAQSWARGERRGVMQPLKYSGAVESRRGIGRRRLNSLSHISYFNQWNLAWVGFTAEGDDRFVGIFSGWGSLWQQRGYVRPDIIEDDNRGHLLRFPLKAGRRLYGIVITNKNQAGITEKIPPCLLNRRKTEFSDLALDKVRSWLLDLPLEEQIVHLVEPQMLLTFRDRIAADKEIHFAMKEAWRSEEYRKEMPLAMALWADDTVEMRQFITQLLNFAQFVTQDIGAGGYEVLGIFNAREAKTLAYDFDILWALKIISETEYRIVRRALLTMAYIIADSDALLFNDFWPHSDPDSGMIQALKNDMGDTPVPPNFAAEFFTTTGVMAELFPSHPQCEAWQMWTQFQMDTFLQTFFTSEGTYLESINYHQHIFNEMLCYFYPAAIHGVRDYFVDPRVRGSFEHFVYLQTPPLADRIPKCDGPVLRDHMQRWAALTPGWQAARRVGLPANGNSGSEGFEKCYNAELSLGMTCYRNRDSQLAGKLAATWVLSGKPFLDFVHSTLTLLTFNPSVPVQTLSQESVWRKSLGIVSRAQQGEHPVYCLFRAGSATHHMCFDQGNLHLMMGDKVLLGEYGYHAHDQHGNELICHETYLHNTLVYAENKHFSSGYTGLERAPEPAYVYTCAAFDWAVHRIENSNFRDCSRYWYSVMLPDPLTVHIRHYLFVKPDYFIIWDTFEAAHQPSLLFLHPNHPPQQIDAGIFRTGEAGEAHLRIQFLQPTTLEIVENEQLGPYWSFAISNPTGHPFLFLLVPQIAERNISAVLTGERSIRVRGRGVDDLIKLPIAGTNCLPELQRN